MLTIYCPLYKQINKFAKTERNGGTTDSQTSYSTASNNAANVDTVDEGLALLRRQPSIRDRKKVASLWTRNPSSFRFDVKSYNFKFQLFEEHIKKQQDQNGHPKPTPRGVEDNNKENEKIIIPVAEKPKVIESTKEKQDVPITTENNSNVVKKNIFLAQDKPKIEPIQNKPAPRPASKCFVRVSKFKHLKGEVMLKGRFENLKNLSRTVPAECNFIQGKDVRLSHKNVFTLLCRYSCPCFGRAKANLERAAVKLHLRTNTVFKC